MTEILAQHDSTGILYEPYHNDFKLCIFEEGDVQGKNERYEFRCDTHLECCGRVCCIPEATAGIPWWLQLLLPLLALLLLLALLSLLYYLCCRKKKKQVEPKKVYRPDLYHGNAAGYRSIKHADDDDDDTLSRFRRDTRGQRSGAHGGDGSYDDLANAHGYGNRAFDQKPLNAAQASPTVANTAFAQRYSPRPTSFHEEETFEESFKEEIEVERNARPSSLSSQESLIIRDSKFR